MNSNGERRIGWPHARDLILVVGILASNGIAYNSNDQTSDIKEAVVRVDERLAGHQRNHPDTGLQRQIDGILRDNAEIRRRLRSLEQRNRSDAGEFE